MNRFAIAVFAGVSAVLLGAAQQFQPGNPAPNFAAAEVKTTNLGSQTYLLQGEGANVVVAVGNDGLIMIDTQFAEMNDKLAAAVEAISPRPVRHIILTHFHRDHTGGNAFFAARGANIVAHEAVKTRLAAGTTNGLTGNVMAAYPEAGLPKQTYNNAGVMIRQGGRVAEVKHVVGHTDGDSYVYFRDANVLVTGDIVTLGRYPNIDVPYGGGIDRMIEGVDVILAAGNDNSKVVPGHGPLGSKDRVVEYRQVLVQARERIAKLIAEGKSEDEAVAARPNADNDAKLGVTPQQAGNFVRVVYRSLK